MKNTRNRLTPFLVIILICLIWLMITILIYKLTIKRPVNNVKKLKLDDDLVQELYSYVTDEDIYVYSNGKYDVSNLPNTYIFGRATRYMTTEDIEFGNQKQIKVSKESLDAAIKTSFGPDFTYDLSTLNGTIQTSFILNEKKLSFNVKYDSTSDSYIGIYSENNSNEILVHKELIGATKTDTVNLKVGYAFYKKGTKYQICNDSKCTKIVKELDSLDNFEFENELIVSYKKASDEVYYYHSNS